MERRVIVILIYLSLFLSLTNLFPSVFWFMEIGKAAWLYFLAVHIITIVYLIWIAKTIQPKRKVVLGALTLLLIGVYLDTLAPFIYQTRADKDFPSAHTIKIAYANTYAGNKQTAPFEQILTKHNPDIVFLIEAQNEWIEGVPSLARYPFKKGIFDKRTWSIGVFSKVPFEGEVETSLGEDLPDVIRGTLALGEESSPLHFALLHVPPPQSEEYVYQGFVMGRRLATMIRHSEENWLVLGDFNATPFNTGYKQFLFATQMEDAVVPFGLKQSWSARIPFLWFTLDHLFVKNNVHVRTLEMMPDIGSDHYGFLANVDIGR